MLAGGGPADVVEVTLALAREMLALAGLDADPADALADGRAMDRWRAMVARPGRRPRRAAAGRGARRGGARRGRRASSSASTPWAVGVAAWRLGAGRARKEDAVSAGAGVVLRVVPGDAVSQGQVVAELHADDEAHMEAGRAAIAGAIRIGSDAVYALPRVRERISAD